RNIKLIASRLGRTDGAEILEAALVLPLVFMLLLGAISFGRAFNIYGTIQQAAAQGALTQARYSCGTCGDARATHTMVDNAIIAVMQAASLDPSQIQLPAKPTLHACPAPWPSGGGCAKTANNVYVCRNVELAGGTQPLQCGTVVTFQY